MKELHDFCFYCGQDIKDVRRDGVFMIPCTTGKHRWLWDDEKVEPPCLG